MKKITAVLLAILLALTVIAACTPAEDTATPTPAPATATPAPASDGDAPPPPAEPITLNVWQWELDNQTTDFANLWYYNQLEEETGVKINWTAIKESEWNEKLNLMFNSLDMPDVIIRPNLNLNIEEYGVLQGLLVPLDDYLEANMPNYYPRISLNNTVDSLRASDGKMYYLGYLVAQNINHNAHFFMNQTWLNAVDKQVPATIDELTDVLRAFRDGAPGASGMYPMSAGGGIEHHIEGIYPYFGMFGVPLQRWVYAAIGDNDKIVFPGYMDGFREACEWLAMCYAEKLLDPDAITQEENAWNEKINSDQIGFATYLRLIASAWANPDTTENWVSILPPSVSSGAKIPRELEIPEFGAVITSANQYIPETLQWLDKQFETQRMLEATNGPLDMSDDVRAILGEDAQDGSPLRFDGSKWGVNYTPDNQSLYKIVPVNQGQFFAPGDYYFDIFDLPPHRIERRDYASQYQAAGIVEKNSYMILTRLLKPVPDDASELQRLFADIESLMRERISNFIINGVTDASWQTFLDEAENIGVGRYLELYQSYYDAFNAVR
ncbi:MAG: extracellular solute-binding protein [Oscillospiraceae bacterium]|nr:extracellular solute-binding protein [Oscillospiraceae bacterium]